MKKRRIVKSLLAFMLASTLLLSGPVHGIATIDSLDFSITGLQFIDCDVLGNVELERDPSWTDEEFLIRLTEEYAVKISEGEFTDVASFREQADLDIEANWSAFYDFFFRNYASEKYPDFDVNTAYYETYTTALKDDYYHAYMLAVVYGEDYLNYNNNYDILANYCTTNHDLITTTFGNDGYYGFVKLGDHGFSITDEDSLLLSDGYILHKDNFGDFRVQFSRVNDTTIKVKYTIKNLTGAATNYGVGLYADVELGDNDDAAIARTDHNFVITQDDPDINDTFGAQFRIELDPVPTSIFIGSYDGDSQPRWESSEATYYTAADGIDTILSYTWQGQINAEESKSFTATYTIDVADAFQNNFYFLSNDYVEPLTTISSIDGGALKLPYLEISDNQGYHREWSTKPDTTGARYDSDTTIIAHQDQNNYYEIEVPNEVTANVEKGHGSFAEQNIVITDEMKERYQSKANEAYSNFQLYVDSYEYPDYLIEEWTESGTFSKEKAVKPLGENYNFTSLFEIDELSKYYVDGDGVSHSEDFEEDEFPITVRIKLSDKLIDNRKSFGVTRAKYNSETEEYENYTVVPFTYNPETGELFITFNSLEDFDSDYAYALSWTEIPEDFPKAPNTGTLTSSYNSANIDLTISLISISIIMTLLFVIQRRKNPAKKA